MWKRLFGCKTCGPYHTCDGKERKFPPICPGHIAMVITGIVLVYLQWTQ